MWTDRQTDISNLTVAFRTFVKEPVNRAHRDKWWVFVKMETDLSGL